MGSRTFFFTTITIAVIAMIGSIAWFLQTRSEKNNPARRPEANIRMNKIITGEVVDLVEGAGIVTIKTEGGQKLHIATASITNIVSEKNGEATLPNIRKGTTIEARGESITIDAMIAAEIRIISTPSLIVTSPTGSEPVTSPLAIAGEATGPWYFEAIFPVSIVDENKKMLGQHYVTATEEWQSHEPAEWMSESLVPFAGQLEFSKPGTETGYLIFKNANPSGLPEYEKTFAIPIVFKQETRIVKIFLNNGKLDPALLCDTVFPITRKIAWTEGIGRAAIEELIKGPTAEEKKLGYFTNIDPNVRVNALTIENGTARIDLSEELDRNVGGACRVTAISSQITETLRQFPTIREVIISINGETKHILQP